MGVGLVFVVIVVPGMVEIVVGGKLPRPPSGFAVVLRLAALVVDMVVDVVVLMELVLVLMMISSVVAALLEIDHLMALTIVLELPGRCFVQQKMFSASSSTLFLALASFLSSFSFAFFFAFSSSSLALSSSSLVINSIW